jgi:predicted DNA-binding transcriptional regulator AlpA
MPTPAAPTLYKSVIPESDFAAAGEYLARMRADRKAAEIKRYEQVGTPAEIGARQAAIRAQEGATYAASLPKGSYYDAARSIAETSSKKAQRAPISTVSGVDPNVFNQADYTAASDSGYSDTEIKDWLESRLPKIGPVPQEKFGLSPDRVESTGTTTRVSEAPVTPSWAAPPKAAETPATPAKAAEPAPVVDKRTPIGTKAGGDATVFNKPDVIAARKAGWSKQEIDTWLKTGEGKDVKVGGAAANQFNVDRKGGRVIESGVIKKAVGVSKIVKGKGIEAAMKNPSQPQPGASPWAPEA